MDYILHLLIVIALFSILAVSLNYLAGFTGILSLNHATFFGVGAYTTAILTVNQGWTFMPSVLIGMLASAAIAFLFSFPLLRMRHDAFILVSLGFTIIMYNVFLNLADLTGGALGLKGIPAPSIFGFRFFEKPVFLLLVLFFLVLTYFIFRHITRSPYAIILKGIRENPTVASVNGHSVVAYQRSAYMLAALFAALAGSFNASFLTFIEPKLFNLMPTSVFILVTVILGGLGNLKGSILGTLILVLIPEFLRFVGFPPSIIGELQQIVYGMVLVLLMMGRPQGLLGEYKL